MYRKFKADALFTGYKIMPADTVLITREDGTIVDIVGEPGAGENIELLNGTLCPGFVNAHCHIELSHLKGKIAQKTGLVNFVQQVMKVRNDFSAEEKQSAMIAAVNELQQTGTVAVGDICNTPDSLLLKAKNEMYWHNFIEVSGFVGSTAAARLGTTADILAKFKKLPGGRSSVAAHSPYSVSAELFQLINENTAGQITSIHNQEALAENELYEMKSGDFLRLYENLGIDISAFRPTGTTSLRSWLHYFNKQQQIISVHNTFTTAGDLTYMQNYADAKLHCCLCINANLYIENSLPPIDLLKASNVNIVLGTDSYASNTRLNIMAEINAIRQHFPHLRLEEILAWATINGAVALGIADKYGSFEKGKRPGLVLIDHNYTSSRIL